MGANQGMCVYMYIWSHTEGGREDAMEEKIAFFIHIQSHFVCGEEGACVWRRVRVCGCVVVRVCTRAWACVFVTPAALCPRGNVFS